MPFRGCDHVDPRARLEHRSGAARQRLPRQGLRQRPVRDRLLRRPRPQALPAARAALHDLRPVALVAARRHVPEPPVPPLRLVRGAQGGPDPTRRGDLQERDDLGPARGREGRRPLLLHGPSHPDPVGTAAVRPHLEDRRLLHRRAGRDAPALRDGRPTVPGREPGRRPPAGRRADGPEVRARGAEGVRAVTAVGARDAGAPVRRVGGLLRPPPAREVPRSAAPARTTRTTSGRAASGSPRW